jgi:hypothetical protein
MVVSALFDLSQEVLKTNRGTSGDLYALQALVRHLSAEVGAPGTRGQTEQIRIVLDHLVGGPRAAVLEVPLEPVNSRPVSMEHSHEVRDLLRVGRAEVTIETVLDPVLEASQARSDRRYRGRHALREGEAEGLRNDR